MLASSLSDYYFTKKMTKTARFHFSPDLSIFMNPIYWVVKENSFSWCSTLSFLINHHVLILIFHLVLRPSLLRKENERTPHIDAQWFDLPWMWCWSYFWYDFPKFTILVGSKNIYRCPVCFSNHRYVCNLCFETVIYFWFSVQSWIIFMAYRHLPFCCCVLLNMYDNPHSYGFF